MLGLTLGLTHDGAALSNVVETDKASENSSGGARDSCGGGEIVKP